MLVAESFLPQTASDWLQFVVTFVAASSALAAGWRYAVRPILLWGRGLKAIVERELSPNGEVGDAGEPLRTLVCENSAKIEAITMRLKDESRWMEHHLDLHGALWLPSPSEDRIDDEDRPD